MSQLPPENRDRFIFSAFPMISFVYSARSHAITFPSLPYPNLQKWLRGWLEHPVFLQAMIKFQPWQEGDDRVVFPSDSDRFS